MNWISVKERLPEESGDYLVSHGVNGHRSVQTFSLKWQAWNNHDWMERDTENEITSVTHWMPLPEPPEEEA